jgi:UDP-N-acetylmuramoyl-L-alanyl-D-glutamate--2,6-diaminopimelate ligase
MRLSDIVSVLPDAAVAGSLDHEIRGFCIDSRRAGPDHLFVALRGGEEQDRHQFIPHALERGTRAVVVEDDVALESGAAVRVPDVKRALALMARRFFGEPDRGLCTVAVTGTCGKTTTTFLVRSVLEAAGMATGRIGTHHNVVGGTVQPSHNTTPYAHETYELLRAMADAGDKAVAMEVSSHALALDRVYGIDFGVGVFTNLSRDHLNFHGTPEAYFAAKALLFERLGAAAWAILNGDDRMCAELARRTAARVMTYGMGRDLDVYPVSRRCDWRGTHMNVATPRGEVSIESNLLGSFNAANLLAATAAACALDIDPATIRRGLTDVHVPGRFESVRAGQPFAVLVDFAHKPDALEKVLLAGRELTKGKLVCVFGCGGDRDRGKRPIMGQISARCADLTIVTSDNPRTEPPDQIVREIVDGIPPEALRGSAPRVMVEVDRREAIARAIAVAGPGDVVLIAGKGDEDYQEIAGVRHPFDDRAVATDALRAQGYRTDGTLA